MPQNHPPFIFNTTAYLVESPGADSTASKFYCLMKLFFTLGTPHLHVHAACWKLLKLIVLFTSVLFGILPPREQIAINGFGQSCVSRECEPWQLHFTKPCFCGFKLVDSREFRVWSHEELGVWSHLSLSSIPFLLSGFRQDAESILLVFPAGSSAIWGFWEFPQ